MTKANKQCRNILLAYVVVVGLFMLCVVAGLYHLAVEDDKYQAVRTTNAHWQQHVNELQDQCGHALDIVAAGMADEEFDSVPLEVWDSAYQRCLLDTGATI